MVLKVYSIYDLDSFIRYNISNVQTTPLPICMPLPYLIIGDKPKKAPPTITAGGAFLDYLIVV
jgi:hypothetical protein